jgi:hypothetical protein
MTMSQASATEPASHGHAVHGRDHRLVEIEAGGQPAKARLRIATRPIRARLELKIVSGAEGAIAGAGHDRDPLVGVRRKVIPYPVQLVVCRFASVHDFRRASVTIVRWPSRSTVQYFVSTIAFSRFLNPWLRQSTIAPTFVMFDKLFRQSCACASPTFPGHFSRAQLIVPTARNEPISGIKPSGQRCVCIVRSDCCGRAGQVGNRPAETRRRRWLNHPVYFDQGIPRFQMRMLERFIPRQHRRNTRIEPFEQFAPLIPRFRFESFR